MTETDAYHEAHLPVARSFFDQAAPAVLSGDFRQVDALVSAMDDDDLTDVLIGLAQRARVDSLMAGRLAYEHRARTPDGEWGRRVRELAALCEVSDRTIHRWMSAYQERAGLAPTPAQANARASADKSSADRAPEPGHDDYEGWVDGILGGWDDGEEAEAAGFEAAWATDGLGGQAATRELVGEAWAPPDSVTPSTRYENAPEPGPAPRRAVLPPDDTWVAFAAGRIEEEFPALAGAAALRNARAQWDRMSADAPLDLLEDLELIYDGAPPDELASALQDAEERRALKPEVVDPGGKKAKRGGGGGGSPGRVTREAKPKAGERNVENGMVYARELHSHVASLLEEGGAELVDAVYGDTVANLQAWAFALDGVLKKVRRAREDQRARGRAAEAPRGPVVPVAGGVEF